MRTAGRRFDGATRIGSITCTSLQDDGFIEQARSFLHAIAQRQSPSSDLADGWQSLLTNLALLEAADGRRWVEVSRVPGLVSDSS